MKTFTILKHPDEELWDIMDNEGNGLMNLDLLEILILVGDLACFIRKQKIELKGGKDENLS